MLSSTSRPIASRVSTVALPTCGSRTTSSRRSSASGTCGSSAKTSSPAPAMRPRLERRDQRVLVDDGAAGDVHQVTVRAERVEDGGVHQPVGAGPARGEHDQHVARLRERDGAGVVGPRDVLRTARVVVHLGAEGLQPLRRGGADTTQPEHADDRAAHVAGQRHLLAARPRATADEPVGRRDPAQHVDDEERGQVGHRVGQHVGGVGHDDAAPLGLGHVDVVVADAEVHDRAQVRQGVHLGRAGRGPAADDRDLDPGGILEVREPRGGVPLREPLAHEGHEPAELDDTDRVLGVGGHHAILAGRRSRRPRRPRYRTIAQRGTAWAC